MLTSLLDTSAATEEDGSTRSEVILGIAVKKVEVDASTKTPEVATDRVGTTGSDTTEEVLVIVA